MDEARADSNGGPPAESPAGPPAAPPPAPATSSASPAFLAGRRRRVLRWLLAAGFCALTVLMVHHPMIASGLGLIQTDPGDTRLNNYLLEHSWRWLIRESPHRSFWDLPMFYPEKNTGAYGDVLLAAAPPYWLCRAGGAEPDTAFQLWMMTVTALNFLAGYWLLRSCFGVGALPAALGATLFAAGSSRMNQLSHQQLVCHVFIVLAMIALHRLFSRAPEGAAGAEAGAAPAPGAAPASASRRRTAAWLAVFFAACVAQCWAGFYNAFFLMLTLNFALVAMAFMPELRRTAARLLRGHWPVIAGLAVVGALLVLPLALHYREAAEALGVRSWGQVKPMLPRNWSWISMGPDSWLYGRLASLPLFTGNELYWEHEIGFGFLTPLVALVGFWRARRSPGAVLILAVGALIVFCTTYWFDTFCAWRVFYKHYPAAGGIRAVARAGMLLLIPAAAGLALFMCDTPRRHLWWKALVVLACILEQGHCSAGYDKVRSRQKIAEMAALVPPGARAFYLTASGGEAADWEINLDALWVELRTRVPTVNGYSGNWPRGFRPLYKRIGVNTPQEAAETERELASWAAAHGLERGDIRWVRYDVGGPGAPEPR